MGIIIRSAMPEEAYEYATCHITCWQSAYRGIVSNEYLDNLLDQREQRAEHYRKVFANPGDIAYYCAMQDEHIVGVLIIDKKGGEIWAIYLLEEFWGKGYGATLFNFAIAELRKEGHSALSLWVFEKNSRARRFYDRYNFKFDGAKKENSRYGLPLVELRYVCNFD